MLDVKDDDNKTYKVLIVNFPTIITARKLSVISEYPQISGDIANTLALQKKLNFDIWVAGHATQFYLHRKHNPGDPYDPQVFIDRAGYDKSLKDLEEAYQRKLQQN